MTNEELVIEIQQGNKALLSELWGQVQKLIACSARKYYFRYTPLCDASSTTVDDLIQEGYFSLLDAINAWTPESGFKFTTYLRYPLQKRFNASCGLRTSRTRNDPLNKAVPLETPIAEDLTLEDTVADATDYYAEADHSIYVEQLHNALDSAMTKLKPEQERVIKGIYYSCRTVKQLGDTTGVSGNAICQTRDAALRKLRQSKRLASFRTGIIIRYGFNGSLSAFKNNGISSTEQAVEALERAEMIQNLKDTDGFRDLQFPNEYICFGESGLEIL